MTAQETVELISKVVAIVGGLTAAFLAIWQAGQNLKQRKRELRWKQAELGKKIIDEIFDYQPSRDALLMVEGRKRHYKITEGDSEVIVYPEIISALRLEVSNNRRRQIYIQDGFDSLFYYLDRIEHFLGINLITFDDVRNPMEYYARKMAKDKKVFLDYINTINYKGAAEFLNRFQSWQQA